MEVESLCLSGLMTKLTLKNASHLASPSNHGLYSLKTIFENVGDYKMNKFENHADKRIRELHERMRKLGNKKNLTNGG